MRFSVIASALLVPLGALAAPVDVENAALVERQQRPVKPKPCVSVANVTAEETKLRHDKFTDAFIVKKNITAAFAYIRQDYINHNPMAQNGFDSAWNILSPIWGNQNIQKLRDTYRHPQGWLNYRSGFGDIVDRFRWEGGCIAEHWDQGERYPTK